MNEQGPTRKLMEKAASLLARRSYSRGEMETKLAPLGDPPEIQSVLDRLEQLNLLNDEVYAYNSASQWIRQRGWGPYKVRHLLMRRKIPDWMAESAIERVRQEISDTSALEAYLDRRSRSHPLPEDRKGIQKLALSLKRRGFSPEAIWDVLRRRIPSSAWQEIETGD